LAEVCAQYVGKGSHVYVAGRLHTIRWEDADTGEPLRSGGRRNPLVLGTCGVSRHQPETGWTAPGYRPYNPHR
jgi:single-stranded DNA-binding protein